MPPFLVLVSKHAAFFSCSGETPKRGTRDLLRQRDVNRKGCPGQGTFRQLLGHR